MLQLEIKPAHKPIKQYYAALAELKKLGASKETSVRAAFQEILTTYARKKKWSFVAEEGITLANGNAGSVDGAIKDEWGGIIGFWEAKDEQDDLRKWIDKKFASGYPKNNILFQKPTLAILIQDGGEVDEYDLTNAERLAACITDFLGYRAEEQSNWEQIVAQFKDRIPESAKKVIEMIEVEKKDNTRFKKAFQDFAELCRAAINPNLADEAVEEMLVQHLLTSRIFTSVFENPEFVRRNVIASEIEKVIDALTSRSFNRQQFFAPLDHFYRALELKAKSITDWSQKQTFLNTVYEKFFQGFAVKVADTHGIVYTPQPIVDFMVRSVQHILKTEFKRSLASEGVHILDPFVGTGNFIMRIIREIAAEQKSKLPKKYASELHCNEVMLLPYYIASMNIEHEYYTQTKEYKGFEGICLVDTFELAEPNQTSLFTTENSERVERQKKSPIFVIIGNPPYNAGQVNENDNNKNRKYPVIDKRVSETYAKDSRASNKNDLIDPYIKAFRWASDRIGKDGVVAFVTNNNFINGIAFDGVRKHLAKEFSSIYHIDLKGNARTSGERRRKEAGNVFSDLIRVGVGITFFVRNENSRNAPQIYLYEVADYTKAEAKQRVLKDANDITGMPYTEIIPNDHGNWLLAGTLNDFDSLMPLGTREAKAGSGELTLFGSYSLGVNTNRDSWAYNFDVKALSKNMQKMCDVYNRQVAEYTSMNPKPSIDDFVISDESVISWSSRLKECLKRGMRSPFERENIKQALYRPFDAEYLYFDSAMTHRRGIFPKVFPLKDSQNLVISLSAVGNTKPFHCLLTDKFPDLHLTGDSQCFPFYTYAEDGSGRKENITDWALGEFRAKAPPHPARLRGTSLSPRSGERVGVRGRLDQQNAAEEQTLTKWDIFYYVYGLLHHPEYRTKYAANLRRELPRIPISPDFWVISECGHQLADLHVNYESAAEYDLKEEWAPGSGLNFKVEKMKLTKDKSSIIYNKDLTLTGIPAEAFEYRLGNRSAIDWIIDQYQVSTDKRSGIVNDPNREDDPQYIVRLLKQVVTVSLETVRIVGEIAKTSLE